MRSGKCGILSLAVFFFGIGVANAEDATPPVCTQEKICNAHSRLMTHILTPIPEAEVKESIQTLAACAEKNHPFAQFAMGYSYEAGNGVPKDTKQALELYLKAASAGSMGAIMLLPDYYNGAMGAGLKLDKAECYAWAAVGRKLSEKVAALARRDAFCKGSPEERAEGDKRAAEKLAQIAAPRAADLVIACK